jgi:hypothetical protein
MSSQLGELTLQDAAREAAGNWRHFECFSWHRGRELNDAENWTIIYTHNRDSGLLDQSNAAAIAEAMDTFTKGKNPDAVPEHHHHWACGWADGFSIRVYRGHRITRAFKAYHALAQRLAQYPLLDEDDFSRREYEATLANLPDAAWKLKNDYELPDNWEPAVYGWLSDNYPESIEDTDDRGGYPSETELRAAFQALGYEETATV